MEWISVNDKLPNVAVPHERCMYNAVLLYTPVDGYVHIGWYGGKDYRGQNKWYSLSAMRSYQTVTKKVSHWMRLPQRPEEE